MTQSIYVIKANGEKELFDLDKLQNSIRKAGIPSSLENDVIAHIREKLYPDIPTSEIYKHLIEFLGKPTEVIFRTKFGLKRAIMELGPSGFPFEKFIAKLLKTQGYETKTNVFLQGRCISHEIDVLAKKEGKRYILECKYHNKPGNKTDVKVALYVQARYEDVSEAEKVKDTPIDGVWLVTNTKCSQDAITYGECRKMKIIAWGYPQKDNLQEMIENNRLYPVTCLSTISFSHKQKLLSHDIVLVKEIMENKELLGVIDLNRQQKENLLKELQSLTI